ncbi:hypothetical protein RQP46_003099 [Phenoliferia psychrophenolica]
MISATSKPASGSRRPSTAYRTRLAVVRLVIAGFRLVGPLSYFVLGLWTLSGYIPSLRPAPTSTNVVLQTIVLAWASSEFAFSILYQLWALRANRRRPPTDYDSAYLRDVVKKVLESDMGSNEEALEDGEYPAKTAPARRDASLRHRRRAGSPSSDHSPDSGYASSSSSFSSPKPSYNFISERLAFNDTRAHDFRETSRQWFHGAPFDSLRREDVSQWMSWSLYGQPFEEVVNERRNSISTGVRIERMPRENDIGRDKLETVETSVEMWEARAAVKLPAGKNPQVGVVRLTLDKMRVMSRPLGLYLSIWVAQRWYRSPLWEPALPFNFLYAPVKSPMSHLMRFFVSRELGVANVLSRHFDWISSNLWPSDVADHSDPAKFSVHLSGKDSIVDTPRVSRYLAREGMVDGAGLRVFEKQRHGDGTLGHGPGFSEILDWLKN